MLHRIRQPAGRQAGEALQCDLDVNLKMARTFGLTIPPAVIAQATEVIK